MLDSTAGLIAILLTGVAVVVGSILLLRLHAFLALISAALVVAVLTPQAALERFHVSSSAFPVSFRSDSLDELLIHSPPKSPLVVGLKYDLIAINPETKRYQSQASVEILGQLDTVDDLQQPTLARLLDPQLAEALYEQELLAIHPLTLRSSLKASRATIGARVANGFGSTAGKIGILIAMAAIIGKCLLDSGAADRIIRTTLKWFGERAAPAAFMTSGFFLGVPVFFDTVFYLMIPLGKALRLRTGRNYLLYVLTIVCGATMAHSLVPPTPGPLLVAEELQVDLGVMIVGGTLVGLCSALFGYCFAALLNRRYELPLRESPDFSLEDLEKSMQVDESQLPPFWLASLPILLPVLLITLQTVVSNSRFPFTVWEPIKRCIDTVGDKNVALMLSALIALGTLAWKKRTSRQQLAETIQAALASGGVIILITSAGGAFGQILRETGVADLIRDLPQASPQIVCILAFLITTAIRTAQGSASVAMITAAGILSGIARDGNLPFESFYVAAAIGCGSKPIAWMNDSGFWVITKMSGMTEVEGLKYITPLTGLMGVVGLLVILLGVTIYPNF